MSLPTLVSSPFQVFPFDVFGAFCFLIIGLWVIFILIAVWVYRDAESRGMSGALWLIIVILLGLIGLIVYLIVRSDHPVGGYPAPYAPGYAPYPGGYPPQYPAQAPPPAAPPAPGVATGGTTCRNCGAPLGPGLTFCPRCGARI